MKVKAKVEKTITARRKSWRKPGFPIWMSEDMRMGELLSFKAYRFIALGREDSMVEACKHSFL